MSQLYGVLMRTRFHEMGSLSSAQHIPKFPCEGGPKSLFNGESSPVVKLSIIR